MRFPMTDFSESKCGRYPCGLPDAVAACLPKFIADLESRQKAFFDAGVASDSKTAHYGESCNMHDLSFKGATVDVVRVERNRLDGTDAIDCWYEFDVQWVEKDNAFSQRFFRDGTPISPPGPVESFGQ